MKNIKMNLGDRSYEISLGCGLLERANELFNLERKVFIITDSGVPKQYSEIISRQAKSAKIFTVNEGEGAKSLSSLGDILEEMLNFGMSRKDCVVAVGGGVVGDLSGFAASIYMRGVDFYNVPTTLLSQVDSSIGGKTAINHGGIKNSIGSFYQPKHVLIDTDTLNTLSPRLFAEGLSEVIKMALTSDAELFNAIENASIEEDIENIIFRALLIKKNVVEIDEKESGLRKILNFGHTLGHGIEALSKDTVLYHGECVALGMLPMCAPSVRKRLQPLLNKVGLPTEFNGDIDSAIKLISHDKKAHGDHVDAVFVDEIGKYRIESISIDALSKIIKENI